MVRVRWRSLSADAESKRGEVKNSAKYPRACTKGAQSLDRVCVQAQGCVEMPSEEDEESMQHQHQHQQRPARGAGEIWMRCSGAHACRLVGPPGTSRGGLRRRSRCAAHWSRHCSWAHLHQRRSNDQGRCSRHQRAVADDTPRHVYLSGTSSHHSPRGSHRRSLAWSAAWCP